MLDVHGRIKINDLTKTDDPGLAIMGSFGRVKLPRAIFDSPGVQDLITFLLDAQSSSVMSAKGMERVKQARAIELEEDDRMDPSGIRDACARPIIVNARLSIPSRH